MSILFVGATSPLNSLGSIQWCCLTWCTLLFKPFAIMTSLPYTGRVRNPVVGCESESPQVVFNVHQSHRHDSTSHSLFILSQIPVVYMWSAAQLGIVMYHTLWSNAVRMVTHPCINQAHDCLTSVIKCKMFAPYYVPHTLKHSYNY